MEFSLVLFRCTTDPTTGVLTATFSSTTTGGKTISATINTVAITQTAGVTVTAGAVSATTSTVEAAPASIPAGAGNSTIPETPRGSRAHPTLRFATKSTDN